MAAVLKTWPSSTVSPFSNPGEVRASRSGGSTPERVNVTSSSWPIRLEGGVSADEQSKPFGLPPEADVSPRTWTAWFIVRLIVALVLYGAMLYVLVYAIVNGEMPNA